MKLDKGITAIVAALLAFCISLGVTGAIVSAFTLPLASFPALVLTCFAAACYCAAAYAWSGGGLLVLLSAALLGGYLWRRGETLEQLLQLIYRISYLYHNAYGWGYLPLTDAAWDAGTADLPMGILGAVVAMTAAWSVSRGTPALFPVTVALLPLFSCLVVTDTVPGSGYLFLLLFGVVMLLMTSRVRGNSGFQGNQLTLLVALPVAAALAAVFLAVPREGYVNHSAEIRAGLQSWLQRLPETVMVPAGEFPLRLQPGEPESVDLASLGSFRESSQPVLYVTAQTGGTVYLRGQDYDVYDGTGWQATAHRAEAFACQGVDLGGVTVETVERTGQLYLPYYPAGGISLVGGRVDNTGLYTQYTFQRTGLADGAQTLAGETAQASSGWPEYLTLPGQTRAGAEELLEGIVPAGASAAQKAQAVGSFVRGCAVYDRDPSRMPREAEDFALWFLKESDRGYCVHFATAAVVLLRAAGVEARYVSGYMVRGQAGERITVTGENAHAWAEYYDPQLGVWLVLEATPASGGHSPDPAQEQVQAPEQATQASQQATEGTAASTAAPTAAPTQPSAAGGHTTPEETAPQSPALEGLVRLGKLILLFAVAAGALAGQRTVRLRLRRQCQRTGTENSRALARWKEAERLAGLLKEEAPDELHRLAQKAKFSQHTLTEDELLAFEGYLRAARKRLRQHPWYRRLVYRYIFAVM